MENRKNTYLFFGFITGLAFVILGLVIDAIYEKIDFYKLFNLYSINPLHYLVLTAPFILGSIGFLLGKNIDNQYIKINKLIETEKKNSKQILDYTKELNKGNVDAECELIKNDDEIGEALRYMKSNISRSIKVEAKRIEEDKRQNWIVEGIAKFGELLRQKYEKLDDLGYSLISKLAQYIDAQQSAIYLIENSTDKDKYLKLLSCYAYDQRKFQEKEILFGEGLVGSCAVEEKTILLTDIPQNYIKINSGLGKSKPNNIIFIPLKYMDETLGVIELATLYSFEKHQIEFLEKVAEITTSTLLTVRNSEQTAKLLEESNSKSEMLAQKEKELRLHMEEIQLTKEETEKRKAELDSTLKAMDAAAYRVEYDLNSNITDLNEAFANILGFTREEALGLSLFDGTKDKEALMIVWKEVLKGKNQKRINNVEMNNVKVWLSETYTPIYDNNGAIVKILKLAFDITEMKKQEAIIKKNEIEYEGQLEAINNSWITAIFDLEGYYLEVNHKFELFAGIEKVEIIGKHHSTFMSESMKNHKGYKNFWKHILEGKTKKGGHQYFFNNEERWIYETFTAVRNENGELSKVILLGNDITKVREKENKLIEKTK